MRVEFDRSRGLRLLRSAATSTWVRAGLTIVLLAVVASQIDWSQIQRRLRDGQPVDFGLAVGVLVVALTIAAARWRALLTRAGVPLGLPRLARIYAVSTFSNTFLPTTMGGDVTRTLLVTRSGPLLPRVATTVVIDRLGGFIGLIALAWIAFAARPDAVPDGALALLSWSTAAFAVGTIALIALASRRPHTLRRVVPERALDAARDARSLLAECARDRPLLILWLVLSVLNQALIALQLVLLAHAIDVNLAFTTAAVALALVTIVTVIPISIGGFGLREASYVVLLGGVSIAAADATLISVLSVAALFVASLPGAYLLMRGRIGATTETAAG